MINKIDILNRGYQAIALDIDGTLLRSDHSISDALISKLAYLNKADMNVVLISARPICSVLQIAKLIGLGGSMIALNGALIGDDKKNILLRKSISEDAIQLIFDLIKSHPSLTWNVYSGYHWYVAEVNELIQNEINIIGFNPDRIERDLYIDSAEKILIMGHDLELKRFKNNIQNDLPFLTYSISKPGYLEITASQTNKYNALRSYANFYNVPLDKFIAFGDGENDIEMIQKCGLGVAMGNATQSLKDAADQIIGTNDEESITQFIGRLF